MKHYAAALSRINARRDEWAVSDDETLQRMKPESITDRFALACVAAERVLGLRLFDVQIAGALAMNDGAIAEMQTGEGKTLAAVLTVYANAIGGRGAHVWTANDYLAQRDAEWMGGIYRCLGLSVGAVTQGMSPAERRRAYACDITYATPNEMGFDYLRDQIAYHPADLVHRPFQFVLIDEADSILIDEARIPLVIAGEAIAPGDMALAMARLISGFRNGGDYFLDANARNIQLTDRGVAKVESTFGCGNIYEARNENVYNAAQNALHAEHLLRRDVDYIVRNESIELVDEFKGRVAQDRRWPAGLQTALEAKERLPLRKQGRILGSITLQNLVAQYPRICGMTGTALTQAAEFRQVYNLGVAVIPTNRPMIRVDEPDVIFPDRLSKERALVSEIANAHATGRPVLVGTASVEESERLSERVRRAEIPHSVLNARNDQEEALIIKDAGSRGAVTISTNMAGRGTDIPLAGEVRALGGLYVIGANKHEARRIDNQLRGRAGRQGDPGSSRFFVSLDDDLLERYGIREILTDEDIDVAEAVNHVQRIVEGQNLEIRKTLWKYEGLVEQHRKAWAERRSEVFWGKSLSIATEEDQPLSEKERTVTLPKMDELWSEYLEAIAELRGGIHWVSWTGKDPLHTFLTRANEIFYEIEARLEQEVGAAMDSPEVPGDLERGATWTYLVNDQPFGTLQERWAKGVVNMVRDAVGGTR